MEMIIPKQKEVYPTQTIQDDDEDFDDDEPKDDDEGNDDEDW